MPGWPMPPPMPGWPMPPPIPGWPMPPPMPPACMRYCFLAALRWRMASLSSSSDDDDEVWRPSARTRPVQPGHLHLLVLQGQPPAWARHWHWAVPRVPSGHLQPLRVSWSLGHGGRAIEKWGCTHETSFLMASIIDW
ncbi:hypothetical protein CC85DRAFT_204517 [Cutaneotrichosporon oleaginosum]|uniref:Uncharacterized protein n=1 Tax=Cutaneotrichosporon oleaginosum TaxID=879819 RepID=A0A0J0XDR4_9TREE|nr:uncharacterized protein CC85DRAFT_204517 [Cutaneotrichosporon oleaginosum]KLT39226.1 hypothetical protein CC85DRAFT_204517 [Cutaneotrichosporon oleaginosum]TXT05719.1 hypothetical protein COLE_07039 [Cutaneotrichosporon oleaginosum]